MTSNQEPEARAIRLPVGMSSPSDVSRAIHELEALDDFLYQSAIRQPGTAMKLPQTSALFEELVQGSELNMLNEADREYLLKSLHWLRDKAPVLHLAFSADPPPAFMEHITTWVRQQLSPFALIRVGLQPTIGAGCMLRTTNKHFDLSLKQFFAKKRDLLKEQLTSQSTQVPQEKQEAAA